MLDDMYLAESCLALCCTASWLKSAAVYASWCSAKGLAVCTASYPNAQTNKHARCVSWPFPAPDATRQPSWGSKPEKENDPEFAAKAYK